MTLTAVELKRILLKVPVLVMLLFIVPLIVASSFVTGIKEPEYPLLDLGTNDYYQALTNFSEDEDCDYYHEKLNEDLQLFCESIESFSNDADYAAELLQSFNAFSLEYGEFYGYGTQETDVELWRGRFSNANNSFWVFKALADEYLQNRLRIYVKDKDFTKITEAVAELNKCFIEDELLFDSAQYDLSFFLSKRTELALVWEKHCVGVSAALNRCKTMSLDNEQVSELLELYYDQVEPAIIEVFELAVNSSYIEETCENITKYADLCSVGYSFMKSHYIIMQAKNFSSIITGHYGFERYNAAKTKDNIKRCAYLLTHKAASYEFSNAYRFGSVLHEPTGTTPHDFIFNNLEIVTIPLIFFGVLVAVFCIYDDIKKNTIVTTLVSPQKRHKIILAKFFAIFITIMLALFIFCVLHYMTAVFVVGVKSAPAVLCVFSGRAITVSPFALLFIYLLGLYFKVMFFASVAALISVTAKELKGIVTSCLLIIAIILGLNFFLSGIGFYQYVPFLALESGVYFGIKPMLASVQASLKILFTLPIMMAIWLFIISTAVKSFNKRDF